MEKYEILGLIPARGGSKGVIRKNIRLLCGKPLIVYTIEEALKGKYLTKIVTSTDDEEVSKISKENGSEVIIRPQELATDDSLVIETVKHAINSIEETTKRKFDYVVLLQPTTPFRIAEDIDNALEKMIFQNGDSVVSLVEVTKYHPARMKEIKNDRIVDIYNQSLDFTPRQFLPKVYIKNGAVYGARREVIFEKNSFRGDNCLAYVMPEKRSINIDTELDFKLAELLMQNIEK